ncbi:paralemmin-2-like isoform X2 [Gouania willdenowi]|nr:paralemmin-2-like isoform X2 [Gouania willdenowi]
MAERFINETGSDGRSVLGMLEVQVEKDPKTGATTVRSLSPISTSAAAAKAAPIFDDGRKSIRAVGVAAEEPTTEELGQILNLIDGVGMKMLLNEIPVPSKKVEKENESANSSHPPQAKSVQFDTHHNKAKKDNDRSRSNYGKLNVEKSAVGVGNGNDRIVIGDLAEEVDHIEDEKLKEGPITLMFLGYADGLSNEHQDDDEQQGVIAVERVLITDDGEELVLGPQETGSLQPPSDKVTEKEGGRGEVSQDVPLNGNETEGNVQSEEGDKQQQSSSSHRPIDGKNSAKNKKCHCCSVM